MEEKLDRAIRTLAGNKLLEIEVVEQLEELIQEYGTDAVERVIVRNGYAPVLLQKYYETVKKMCALQGEKEREK